MTVHDAQKDIYAISSSLIIFAAIKLYKKFLYFIFCKEFFKFSVLIAQLRENNLK